MDIRVSFRGKPLTVGGLEPTTPLAELKDRLEKLTSVPVANQKLIFKGKALRTDCETLGEARIFPVTSGAGMGSRPPPRLMLVGSTPSEVEVARSGPPGRERNNMIRNDLDGVTIPKGYKRVSLNYQASSEFSPFSPYRFQRIETLPGLPEEETARKILETLADDPGIRAVLEKHRWTVGALCELYPEGKVGVSKKTVMGLNQNKGMKIFLRLRTDDLRGFRKILSIRKVLYHELAHNDVSPHNDDFYMLMRQVEREAAELDWTQQSGRTVAGRQVVPCAPGSDSGRSGAYVLVKEAFEGGSGRLGGDSAALNHIFSAAQLAGQAAVERLTPEEQEVEDCCGHTSGNEDAAAAATAETRSVNTPEWEPSAREIEGKEPSTQVPDAPGVVLNDEEGRGSSRASGGTAEVEAGNMAEVEVTAGAAVSPAGENSQLGDDLMAEVADGGGGLIAWETAGKPSTRLVAGVEAEAAIQEEDSVMRDLDVTVSTGDDDQEQEGPTTMMTTTTISSSEQQQKAACPVGYGPVDAKAEMENEKSAVTQCSGNTEGMEIEVRAGGGTPTRSGIGGFSTTQQPKAVPARPTAPASALLAPSPLDELLAMGFLREDAIAALAATGGFIPDAAYRLLTKTATVMSATTSVSGSGGLEASGATGAGDASSARVGSGIGGGGSEGAEVVRLSRDVRLHRAAETIAGHRDETTAIQCLDALTGIFRNLMEHPEEAKFRRIRRSNGKFKASVGSVPGGIDVLLAAGFEERATDILELGRQDPGLIWLAKSTLEVCMERLADRGVDV